MNVNPLHDWAVIRPTGAEEMTAGGLYIPDTAKEKPQEGVVIVIGPGAFEEEKSGGKKDEKKEKKFRPTTVKPGDLVLYERYAGQTYTINNEDLVLVRERDILGILLERKPRPAAIPSRLQIPAQTSASGSTALMKRAASVASKPAKKKVAKKTVKKAVKKTVKKSAKPAAKKTKTKKGKKK